MRILRFISLICISLIAIVPNTHANASQPDFYVNYQDATINVFKEMLAKSSPEQAANLKALHIVFTAAPPGDSNSWCTNPWNPALRSEYKGKPLIVVCPFALTVFADYFTAGAVVVASKIKRRDVSALGELSGMEQFLAEANEKLARFHLAKAATSYTQMVNGEAGTRCPPSAIAYAVVQNLPIGTCESSEDPKISAWLNSFGMDENEVNDLWQTSIREVLSAIVLHEIGHVVHDNSKEQKKLTAVEEEIAADKFALQWFNSGPQYIMREVLLANMQILWSHIAIFSLDTKYQMPAHETTRLEATVKMSSCAKYQEKSSGRDSPEITKLANELRKLNRRYGAVNCEE